MCAMKVAVALLLLTAVAAGRDEAVATANPIRRVVSMLQMMQKKIEQEAEKEKEIFDKYMCWCDTGASSLAASIDAAETKIPQLESSIKEAQAQLAQTKIDLKQAQADRDAAKAAMEEAQAIRDKEAAEFAKASGDLKTNIAAIKKAVAAIEKGMAGTFLQTKSAQVLRNIVVNSDSLSDFDRNAVVAFLSMDASQGYTPQSHEIVGILKQMGDTMQKDLDDLTAAEEAAIKNFKELMAAKTKEIAALTKSIEEMIIRIGDLGVSIARMMADLDDTQKALLEDKKFLEDLDANCAKRKEEWAVVQKTRSEELLAIAETIKLLNSDDALELFKKTLPGSSLIQLEVTQSKMRAQALAVLQGIRRNSHNSNHLPLELITMALCGKKVDFSKVLNMIDELVVELKKEQLEDDHKKEFCEIQIDKLEDQKKELEHTVQDLETLIEDLTEKITATTAEIEALKDGIEQLDKDVAEATDNRKEENEEYKELMASNAAAKDLLGMAKNRMNKFYNPSLYEPAALGQLNQQDEEAPPPPPEAVKAYAKKSQDSNGVIAMINGLIAELDKEMTTAEVDEKNAQEQYELFMSDSAEKRADDTKSLTDKSAAKADMEGALAKAKEDKAGKIKELMATAEVLADAHGDCDWLLQNFDLRETARANEVDSLKKAHAILSGADYSLVQQVSARALRGHAS